MSLGDGSSWDETSPTNATLATLIDDYDRDLRVGVRSRMAHEHEWPASQSTTAQGGQHKFITLQNQATKPTVSGTQLAAVYTKTMGSGLQELFWENEAGTEVQLTRRSNPAGTIVQIVSTNLTAYTTSTATIPCDNTVPQIGEGVEILTKAITPVSATNNILIQANVVAGNSVNGNKITLAAFKATTGDAIAAIADSQDSGGTTDYAHNITLNHVVTPGTTAAVTYSVRIGGSGAGTTFVNGFQSTGVFNGLCISNLTLMEIAV